MIYEGNKSNHYNINKIALTDNPHHIPASKTVKSNTPTFQKNTFNMNKLVPDPLKH